MPLSRHLLLFVVIKVLQAFDYGEWASSMDRDLRVINRESALQTWAGLVGAYKQPSFNVEELRTAWRRQLCGQAKGFAGAPVAVSRAAYLLCRGAQPTYPQTRVFAQLLGKLNSLYMGASLCRGSKCFHVEPDLDNMMKISRDPMELTFMWQGFRDAIGPVGRVLYEPMIKIQNEMAKNNDYSDMGECWREELEVPSLEAVVERLMAETAPLHRLLHAYVRWSLSSFYGPRLVSPTGPIPAHLLGNMWSQSWENIIDIVLNTTFDLDTKIQSRYKTVNDLLKEAERYYVEIGLKPMTKEFWKNSVVSKENDQVMCHGTAANLFAKNDYRMLLCASLTWDDFYVVHHEMGHIQYFMAYENMPVIFQDGANSAFQEAIGDTIMLAVETPSHLNRLGIFNEQKEDNELPLLLYQALKKIPQIPFGLIVDKWRWGVMASNITPEDYNTVWWEYRHMYEGITPPVPRPANAFDPIAKFHIADNTPYVRYFLSIFLQFQFLDVLCYSKELDTGEQKKPLHLCDLHGYKEGGHKLRKMMSQGNLKTWKELLVEFSEGRYYDLSSKPLLNYFAPLTQWLQQQIQKYNIPVGW